MNIASAAISTGAHELGRPARSGRVNSVTAPASVPSAIAIPPIVGVGVLCQRSGLGGTTAPMAGAVRRTSQPAATDTAVAMTNAIR